MSDRETPSTSWAVWAWQAYREGRLVEASALPAVTVGVRQLQWAGPRKLDEGGAAYDAYTTCGHYIATDTGWFLVGRSLWFVATSLEAAKAAAQADYEARILAALDLTPVVTAGVQEVRDQAFREAAGVAGEEAVKVFLRQRRYATTIMREARRQSVAVPVMRLIGTPHPKVSKDDG